VLRCDRGDEWRGVQDKGGGRRASRAAELGMNRPAERTRLSTSRKLAFSAVAFAGFLGVAEGAARLFEAWHPTRIVEYGRGFDAASRVFEPASDDPGKRVTSPGMEAFFPRQSFAARKPPGTLRIVVLGGSSICRLEPQFEQIEADLKAALGDRAPNVEALNLGGLSYGSGRLVGVALEMLQYEPDVVVLYETNNEFTELEQLHLASSEQRSFESAMSWSAVVRIVRDAAWNRRLREVRDDLARQSARTGAAPAPFSVKGLFTYEVTPAQAQERMRAFRDNCAFIVNACRAKGVRVVLGAAPSNLVRPFLRSPQPQWSEYQEVSALFAAGRFAEADSRARSILAEPFCRHQSSDVENTTVRELAREMNVALADVEAAVRAREPHHMPGETLFVDHCHLNDEGNVVLRQTLEAAVLEALGATSGGK
jgi:hypothetical protein